MITNLPQRMFDLIFRPYPWQLHDTSQRLGAIGTLIAVGGFFALLGYAWRSRRNALRLTAPLLYPFLFLLVAYSLSAGNAGTGFRYRSHLVLLGAGMLIILREHLLARKAREPRPVEAGPVEQSADRGAIVRLTAAGNDALVPGVTIGSDAQIRGRPRNGWPTGHNMGRTAIRPASGA